MSLCPDCTYQEMENKAGGSVKSYVKTATCTACQAAQDAQNAIEDAKRPYMECDVQEVLEDIKAAFTGRMLEMGGVFAVIDPYIAIKNWQGLHDQLEDLVVEGVSRADVNLLKATLAGAPHNIDIDNIPAGV